MPFSSRTLPNLPRYVDPFTLSLHHYLPLLSFLLIQSLQFSQFRKTTDSPSLLFPKQSVLATEVLYNPAIACVKFSVLPLYRRIFPSRRFRIILYVIGAIVFLYSWIIVFAAIFQCKPIHAVWDPSVKGAKCFPFNTMVVVFAILNAVTDVTTMLIPLPLLWRLHMPSRQKLQLMIPFVAGGL